MNSSADVLAWHQANTNKNQLETIKAHYKDYPKISDWNEWEKKTKKTE